MRAPLAYWLMIANVIELEKWLLLTWNVWRLFVNSLTAECKYSLISKDNSMRTIQRHLSQKQNFFSRFFSAFLESAFNFKLFQKKMTLIGYAFPKLRTRKTRLNKCLKAPVWEAGSTGDMGNGRKQWFNLKESGFIKLISDMKCLKTFC